MAGFRGGRWWLLATVVTWLWWVVVDNVGGGKTNQCSVFVVCSAKSNVSVCRESTWANTDLIIID